MQRLCIYMHVGNSIYQFIQRKKKSCQLEVVQERPYTLGTPGRIFGDDVKKKNPDKDLLRQSSDRILKGDSTNIYYITFDTGK